MEGCQFELHAPAVWLKRDSQNLLARRTPHSLDEPIGLSPPRGPLHQNQSQGVGDCLGARQRIGVDAAANSARGQGR